VLGATGASGRIATHLALERGARVTVAGRDRGGLADLLAHGAAAAVDLARPHDEVVAAMTREGPFDLVVDYLWGAPAEAALAALSAIGGRPERVRYVLVGMAAGERASVPAVALRRAPVQLAGSGFAGPAGLEDAAAAFASIARRAATGALPIDVDARPLADVGRAWAEAPAGRRVVLIP